MYKKLSVLLVVALAAAALASCGGTNQNAPGAAQPAAGTAAAQKSEETTTTAQPAEEKTTTKQTEEKTTEKPNDGGDAVTLRYFAINWGDLPLDSPGSKVQADIIAEKTGVRIDFVDLVKPDNATDALSLKIAAGEKFDLIQTGSNLNYYHNLINEGYLHNIKPDMAEKLPNALKYYDPQTWVTLSYKDGIYALAYENAENVYTVMTRKDLFEKHGHSLPVTVDELIDSVSDIVKNENNIPGIIQPWDGLADLFAGSYVPKGNSNWLDTDGCIKPWYLHDGYTEYLGAVCRLYSTGCLPKDYTTQTYAEWEERVGKGEFVLTFIYTVSNFPSYDKNVKSAVPDAKLEIIGPFKGKYDGGFPASNGRTSDLYFIPENCKDFDAAYRYANFVNSPEGYAIAAVGIDGVHYKSLEKSDEGIFYDPDFVRDESVSGENGISAGYRFGVPVKVIRRVCRADLKDLFVLDSTFKTIKGDDFGLVYDQEIYKSKDIISDLNDLISVETTRIILGQAGIDTWPSVIEKWYQMGGQTLIDDMTAQYKEWKE